MSKFPMEVPIPINHGFDLSPYLPDRKVMVPVHAAARGLLHPHVVLEAGAAEELASHHKARGSLLLLMTHFKKWEVVHMADVANEHGLQQLRYTTGITAKRNLFNLRFGAGYVVRHSGAQAVDRSIENPNETPEQVASRRALNRETQVLGGLFLANGYHWLIFPEGGSKRIVTNEAGRPLVGEDGKVVREKRSTDELLPLQYGFVDTLETLASQALQRVKLLGLVAHYGSRRLASVRPTIFVTRPESPVAGTRQDILQQATDLLSRGMNEAIHIDHLRR